MRPGTREYQQRLRDHLLAELRDCAGQLATTAQLAEQTPSPWSSDLVGWDRCAEPRDVYPHLRALESQGLVRRVTNSDTRGVVWRLVTPGGVRLRVAPVRR